MPQAAEKENTTAPEVAGGKTRFTTGAVRSADAADVRYDLISPIGERRLAETYAEGARKYGDNNWLKGLPASDLMNHAKRHINLWLTGDASEDHLAHAAWNLVALMHFEETRPDLIDVPARPKPQSPASSSQCVTAKAPDGLRLA